MIKFRPIFKELDVPPNIIPCLVKMHSSQINQFLFPGYFSHILGGLSDFASLCTVAALLGAVSATLVVLINQEQPQPYMVSLSLLEGCDTGE